MRRKKAWWGGPREKESVPWKTFWDNTQEAPWRVLDRLLNSRVNKGLGATLASICFSHYFCYQRQLKCLCRAQGLMDPEWHTSYATDSTEGRGPAMSGNRLYINKSINILLLASLTEICEIIPTSAVPLSVYYISPPPRTPSHWLELILPYCPDWAFPCAHCHSQPSLLDSTACIPTCRLNCAVLICLWVLIYVEKTPTSTQTEQLENLDSNRTALS